MSTQQISIQESDFNHAQEYEQLRGEGRGAIVTFCGLVREFSAAGDGLYLDHYPAMTEKVLHELAASARQRWTIQHVRIIHRVGLLQPGEQIVFIGVASGHRQDAFAACEFLIDALKTQAPFWKKEGESWVAAKDSDRARAERWLDQDPVL